MYANVCPNAVGLDWRRHYQNAPEKHGQIEKWGPAACCVACVASTLVMDLSLAAMNSHSSAMLGVNKLGKDAIC